VAIGKCPDQASSSSTAAGSWNTPAWLTKFRRLVRNNETLPATHEAMIWIAATWQLSNSLTR
jgi:hypothetical protein